MARIVAVLRPRSAVGARTSTKPAGGMNGSAKASRATANTTATGSGSAHRPT